MYKNLACMREYGTRGFGVIRKDSGEIVMK
jgi:hypothetical protein